MPWPVIRLLPVNNHSTHRSSCRGSRAAALDAETAHARLTLHGTDEASDNNGEQIE